MIDRNARNKFAETLRHFVTGQISNFAFEQEIPKSKDPAVVAIESSIWCFYDDFIEQNLTRDLALSKEIKRKIARWILFLYSNEEYKWPFISAPGVRPLDHGFVSVLLGKKKKEKYFMMQGDYQYWPFLDKETFNKAKSAPKLLSGKWK